MWTEILAQLGALVLAVWLIKRGYVANKYSKPHNLQAYLPDINSEELSRRLDAYFYAMGFVAGLVIILFIVLKLFNCGIVCGPTWF